MGARKCVTMTGVLVVWASLTLADEQAIPKKNVAAVLDFTMKNIDGQETHLGQHQGEVLLLVNVASECGLTAPQYEGLEALYGKYKGDGFRVLAFPANNFGQQEPGTNKQIKKFCRTQYDVTFDLFAKISVKGEDQCELYKFLTDKKRTGEFAGEIQWNFQKFLIDRSGQVVARFDPREKPLSKKITQAIEAALQKTPIPAPSSARGQG